MNSILSDLLNNISLLVLGKNNKLRNKQYQIFKNNKYIDPFLLILKGDISK